MLSTKRSHAQAKAIKRDFAYTRLIRCGVCDASVTAWAAKGETYYRCTLRKSAVVCGQRRTIREDRLEDELLRELSKYTIPREFYRWARQKLAEAERDAVREREKIYETQDRTLQTLSRELDVLIGMRARDLLSDDEFIPRRDILRTEMRSLRDEVDNRASSETTTAMNMRRALDFAFRAEEVFHKGSIEARRALIGQAGEGYTLMNGRISFTPAAWLVPLRSVGKPTGVPRESDAVQTALDGRMKAITPCSPTTESSLHLLRDEGETGDVQTRDYDSANEKTAALTTVFPQWCTILDRVQDAIRKEGPNVYIPEFDEYGGLQLFQQRPREGDHERYGIAGVKGGCRGRI